MCCVSSIASIRRCTQSMCCGTDTARTHSARYATLYAVPVSQDRSLLRSGIGSAAHVLEQPRCRRHWYRRKCCVSTLGVAWQAAAKAAREPTQPKQAGGGLGKDWIFTTVACSCALLTARSSSNWVAVSCRATRVLQRHRHSFRHPPVL